MSEKGKVYVLYGVAKRDPDELVCMFFDSKADLNEFRESLPGKYRVMALLNLGKRAEDIDFKLYRSKR